MSYTTTAQLLFCVGKFALYNNHKQPSKLTFFFSGHLATKEKLDQALNNLTQELHF